VSFNLKVGDVKAVKKLLLLVLLSVVTLFSTIAFAQESVCFTQGQEQIITNSLCQRQTGEVSVLDKPLSYFSVQVEPAGDRTSLEVNGIAVNTSNRAISVSMVNFNVIDKKQGHILTNDNAVILSDGVIQPGEELAFSKLINTDKLGKKVKTSNLRADVTGSVYN
jgi:hypothetical protein